MISVSDEFYNLMQVRTNFLEYATVILQDNTEFNLTPADFTITNNSITDGAGSNALPLGVAVEKLVQIEIANPDEKYNEYDFYGAVVDLQIRFQLSNSVETLTRGVYTVIQPAHYGDTIIITAADDMYKADKLISGTITFPTTLGTLATVLCTATDITLASSTFTNSTLTINSFSGDITQYTYRQLFGFIAQLAGGNARINYDSELEFITYNKSKINTMVDSTDGDVVTVSTDFPLALTFDEDPSTFQDMSILLIDSTSTTVYSWAWNTLQTYINDHTITLPTNATIQAVRNVPCILEVKWLSLYDGVWHSYRMLMPDINREIVGIEVLDKWNNLTVETDDIEITGIKTVLSAEQLADDDTSESDTVLVGTDEYVLEVSNPMLNYSNASTVLANVATLLVGLKLRPFSGDHVSNPIIEFMDPVFVVNKRGRTYASIITDIQFNVLGYTAISNSAEPKLRNGQMYKSASVEALRTAVESAEKKTRAIRNYFWHDTDGAHVSTVENDATTGPNTLIDANGMAVREDETEVARFGGTEIELGKNSPNSIIKMIDDKMELSVEKREYPFSSTDGYYKIQEEYVNGDTTTEKVFAYVTAVHKNGNTTKNALLSLLADAINNESRIDLSANSVAIDASTGLSLQLGALALAIGSGSNWTQIDLTAATDLFHYSHYDIAYETDANSFTRNGFVRLPNSHGVSNLPESNACYVLTLGSNASNKVQFCTAAKVSQFVLHMRKCSSGTWGSWKSITFS